MYRAKWDGRNRYAVFESGMQDTVQERMELEMDLREALETRPVLPRLPADARPQRHEPDRRRGADPLASTRRVAIVQPDAFIPLLEETGLITEVGTVGAARGVPPGAPRGARPGTAIAIAVNVSGAPARHTTS